MFLIGCRTFSGKSSFYVRNQSCKQSGPLDTTCHYICRFWTSRKISILKSPNFTGRHVVGLLDLFIDMFLEIDTKKQHVYIYIYMFTPPHWPRCSHLCRQLEAYGHVLKVMYALKWYISRIVSSDISLDMCTDSAYAQTCIHWPIHWYTIPMNVCIDIAILIYQWI